MTRAQSFAKPSSGMMTSCKRYIYHDYILVWWQLWSFLVCQVKFNRYLYSNKHIQKIFRYLERLFESNLSKLDNFEVNFWSQISFYLSKTIFLSQYQIKKTTFINNICNSKHSQKSLCFKNVSQFWQLLLKKSKTISKNTLSMLIVI